MIYLDNNATTRTRPEVVEEMLPYFGEIYGNPGSPHRFGGRAEAGVTTARRQLAKTLGCSVRELYFTSGGTESDNLAIRGLLATCPDKRHIITTRVEHSAVLLQCRELERQGYRVEYLPVDAEGHLEPDQVAQTICPDTALVSMMWANNETGVIFPVEAVGTICRAAGIPLHVDAVQAFGKLAIDLTEAPVDLLAVSAHKIHGPKGVGALYVRRGTEFRPIVWGGHQERGKRPGTEPTALICGFGKAAELAIAERDGTQHTIGELRDRLESGLLEAIPGARLNGAQSERLENTTNLCFPEVDGDSLLVLMDREGIAASSGSACLSNKLEPSHVLLAMGVPEPVARGAVRFSLSHETTAEEIERVISAMPQLVSRAAGAVRELTL